MPKVTFIGGPDGRVELEGKTGQSLLDLAEHNDVKMGSACGGVCACSSCHTYVLEGAESLEEASDAEDDRLDMAFDVRSSSRLGCQVKIGERDVIVQLTEESIETWYNEHPHARPEKTAG